MKDLFLNPQLQYLRAGWRMAIFAVIAFLTMNVAIAPFALAFRDQAWFKFESVQVLLTYSALTVAAWVMLRFVDRRPFVSVGLHFRAGWGREIGQGVAMGTAMMSAIAAVLHGAGWVSVEFRSLETGEMLFILGNSLVTYIAVGYGEEFMFRGYLFQTFREGTNTVVPVAVLSLLFAAAHMGNPNVSVFGLINIAMAGVWLSLAYVKTNALWFPMGLHFSWNFTQGFVYSLPVSGTTSPNTQIGTAVVTGPEWLTGGSFGPEGGALATIVLIVATLAIVLWPAIRPAEGSWTYASWQEERLRVLTPAAPAEEGTVPQ